MITRQQILEDCQLYLKDVDIDCDRLAECVWSVYSAEDRENMINFISLSVSDTHQDFLDSVSRLVTHYDQQAAKS